MSRARRPILLIAYKFPPYAGVGAFRWAKLSKYLARLGHEVHVATVRWPAYGPNTLIEDAAEPGVVVHAVRSGSPHRLRHRPLGRRAGAARHLSLRALDTALFYDDEAQRWGRHLIGACERLIDEHGIEVAVATGHPFQANRWAAVLKRRRPGLRLVQDFRDPWADNPFRPLRAKQAARVRDWQREAVAAADVVVSVTPSLLELYLRDAAGTGGVVIPNGVDPETVGQLDRDAPGADGRIRLTHIGNVSNGRDRPLGRLLDAVRRMGSDDPAVEVVLVGAMLEPIARAHPDLVQRGRLWLQPPLPQAEALRTVAEGNYALQLNAREFPYLVSTKVYEYALLRVPALSLNYGGEVDQLVRDRGFGYSIDLTGEPDLEGLMRSLPERAATDRDRFAFDVEPYTHPRLAARYSALVESL